jgi:tRNA A37 threonylcarbamoyladenosine modification protein TsaB
MHYYLIVQYPYETVDIGLCQNGKVLNSISLHKFDAISKTIPSIQQLLASQNLTLSDISFFGANVGPGPYNTLRAILTMLNGIHNINKIPLVGINALDLVSQEIKEQNYIVVLNAFENNLFYKLQNSSQALYGASSVAEIINIINLQPQMLTIQGNGAIKYLAQFKNCKKIIWPEEITPFNRLETLAHASYNKFIGNDFTISYLKPTYFEDLATNK